MISIIVPVYKAEKYLHRCVDSILAQSCTDFELLLIDDGSPDKSGRICDEYAAKDSRVRVFHKENGGVSSARNFGLDEATGEWLVFIDSDDYIHYDYLKELYVFHDADLIVGSYKMVGTDTPTDGVIPRETFSREQLKDALLLYGETGNFRGAMCKMYKREIINQNNIRYDVNMSASEDWLFALEYIKYVSIIKTCDRPYYFYEQENTEGLSKHARDFDSYFYAMEQFYIKVKELESYLDVEGLDAIYIDTIRIYIRRQIKYLYYRKEESYSVKLKRIKCLLENSYANLVFQDKFREKSRKKHRIFDILALSKCYSLLLLYIYLFKAKVY